MAKSWPQLSTSPDGQSDGGPSDMSVVHRGSEEGAVPGGRSSGLGGRGALREQQGLVERNGREPHRGHTAHTEAERGEEETTPAGQSPARQTTHRER